MNERSNLVPQPPEIPNRVRRIEIGFVFLFTILGGYFRMVDLDRDGISHFDEGVYVILGAGGEFPGKEFFSPPLFPLLLRFGFLLFGPSDVSALALSALVGTATIPLVWWVARRWHGPVAAACSLVMAACSGFHVAFSRMALTDASFAFAFVLALGLAHEMYERGCMARSVGKSSRLGGGASGWPWVVAAGLAFGAAMNIKYNGFIALVFAASPVAVAVIRKGTEASLDWKKAVVFWGAASSVALLLYYHWFNHIESTVGYSQLLSHQRGYSSGLSAWPGNIVTFVAHHWSITPWPGRIGLALGILAAFTVQSPARKMNVAVILLLAMAALSLGLALGDSVAWILGLIVSLRWLRDPKPAGAIQAAWMIGLFMLTPIYRPYARLMLPLIAGGWIATGGLVAELLGCWESIGSSPLKTMRYHTISVACIALGLFGATIAWRAGWHPDRWLEFARSRSNVASLSEACEEITRRCLPENETVFAFVRPPVLVYVGSKRSVDLRSDLRFLNQADHSGRTRFVLIDQAMFLDNAPIRQQLEDARDRLEFVGQVQYRPGVSVLLDDFGRDCLRPEIWDRTRGTASSQSPDEPTANAQQDAWQLGPTPYQLFVYRIRTP